MLSIMLVAGESVDKLSKFLEDKNTLKTRMAIDSLTKQSSKIKFDIIDIDKLVIMDNFESHAMMISDLSILKELLTNSQFFKVKEILYLSRTRNDRYLEFFEFTMEESHYANFTVQIDDDFSFPNIYNYILGLEKEEEDTGNRYKNIYRVRKSKAQEKRYDIEELETLARIEPFDYSSVESYKKLQRDIGVMMQDDIVADPENRIEPYENELRDSFSELEEFEIVSKSRKNIILTTGERKSGVTVMNIGLGTSAADLGKRVLHLDLNDNQSTSISLEVLGVEKNILLLKDLQGRNLTPLDEFLENSKEVNINLISARDFNGSSSLRYMIVEYLLSRIPDTLFDVILIDFPIQKYKDYIKLFLKAKHMVITSSLRYTDVRSMLELLSIIKQEHLDRIDKIFIPVKLYNEMNDTGYIEVPDMKEIIEQQTTNFMITSELSWKGLKVSGKLFSMLFGGKNGD